MMINRIPKENDVHLNNSFYFENLFFYMPVPLYYSKAGEHHSWKLIGNWVKGHLMLSQEMASISNQE